MTRAPALVEAERTWTPVGKWGRNASVSGGPEFSISSASLQVERQ
jgi:hypothetical protein